MINRISCLQAFLTRLRNRGMDIDTLTSGPGVVYTVKDFNECLSGLCSGVVSYGEKEARNRQQAYMTKINHLENLAYLKDLRIESLKRKLDQLIENNTRVVNSKIYEKGTALVFEFDRNIRELRFYKENTKEFESEITEMVRNEFREIIRKKDIELDLFRQRAINIRETIQKDMGAYVSKEQFRINKEVKNKAH